MAHEYELNMFIRTGRMYLQPITGPSGLIFYEEVKRLEAEKGVTDPTMSPIARREAFFKWTNPDGSDQRFFVATDGRGRIDTVVTPGHDRTERFEQDSAWVTAARQALTEVGVPRKED